MVQVVGATEDVEMAASCCGESFLAGRAHRLQSLPTHAFWAKAFIRIQVDVIVVSFAADVKRTWFAG